MLAGMTILTAIATTDPQVIGRDLIILSLLGISYLIHAVAAIVAIMIRGQVATTKDLDRAVGDIDSRIFGLHRSFKEEQHTSHELFRELIAAVSKLEGKNERSPS